MNSVLQLGIVNFELQLIELNDFSIAKNLQKKQIFVSKKNHGEGNTNP